MMFSLFWLASHPWWRRSHRQQPQEEEEQNPRRAHTKQNKRTLLLPSLFSSRRALPPPPPSLEDMNLMSFLQDSCPSELLPKILAYCTPQKIATLSRVDWTWYRIIMDDATWRVLCEELYKWSDGDNLPSTSWREYYQANPCVPVDYPTLSAALATCETRASDGTIQQSKSIRILLRPGTHVLREAITIQAVQGADICIETCKGTTFTPVYSHHALEDESNRSSSKKRRLARKFRSSMNCRSRQDSQDAHDDYSYLDHDSVVEHHSSANTSCTAGATLVLKTRRPNEPLLRVKQGNLHLSNIQLLHNCLGMDIWNGNACIQIQPPKNTNNNTNTPTPPPPTPIRPQVWMDSVDVVSHSGRGIVNIDGGFSSIQNCHVHECAATGIYVGGPGTQAIIIKTDVLNNGNGNTRARGRGGVGRGHSGVYLEQGKAIIRDCNISRNSLTGISAVSLHNTLLDLEESDLVANGMAQLEMPRGGTSRDLERNNRLAAIGLLRSRSGLVASAVEHEEERPEQAAL